MRSPYNIINDYRRLLLSLCAPVIPTLITRSNSEPTCAAYPLGDTQPTIKIHNIYYIQCIIKLRITPVDSLPDNPPPL